jgi:hypothetical protein
VIQKQIRKVKGLHPKIVTQIHLISMFVSSQHSGAIFVLMMKAGELRKI